MIQESQVQFTGFDFMKELYENDADFKEAFEACFNTKNPDRSPWMEEMIHDDLLFKNNQLFIPICSMREKLIKEKHSGGLSGHFEHEKPLNN
jgi:hypothetical protein